MKEHRKRIMKALKAMADAESLLDYDKATLEALDRLNEYTEKIEEAKPFLKERTCESK